MARLYDWLTDQQRNPKIIGSRLNDEFDNILTGGGITAAGLAASAFGEYVTMMNGIVVASVSGNALTLAIKTAAGTDPTSTDKVLFVFRSVTPATGTYVLRSVTAALSITIPSSATLGHSSARDQQIILYGIDNAGAVELAVATPLFDQFIRLQTTTTIGAGSTSATGFYSATGRSNVPWSPIARLVSNQTTAGTWAAAPTQIDVAPFSLPAAYCHSYRSGNQTGIADTIFTKININATQIDPGSWFDSTNNRIIPKVPGVYVVICGGDLTGTPSSGGLWMAAVAVNGSRVISNGPAMPATGNNARVAALTFVSINGTTDYLELQVFMQLASGTGTATDGLVTYLVCARVGP